MILAPEGFKYTGPYETGVHGSPTVDTKKA